MADCLLCEFPLDEAVLISTTSRHGHASRRVACLRCSLVQVSPQPTEAELLAYYRSHAYRTEHGPVPLTLTMPHGGHRVVHPEDSDYEDALEAMANFRCTWGMQRAGLIAGMRLLELGSGDGRTLAAFAGAGLTVTGVEPDEEESEASRARTPDGRVFTSTIDDFLAGVDETFDVIAMYHVLEHVHRPREVLRRLRERLTPRGALIVEVPNILQPSPDIDGYHLQHVHLADFSERTLLAALVLERFEPVWVHSSGNIRCVARPTTRRLNYDCAIHGSYTAGFLDAVRWLHGAGAIR